MAKDSADEDGIDARISHWFAAPNPLDEGVRLMAGNSYSDFDRMLDCLSTQELDLQNVKQPPEELVTAVIGTCKEYFRARLEGNYDFAMFYAFCAGAKWQELQMHKAVQYAKLAKKTTRSLQGGYEKRFGNAKQKRRIALAEYDRLVNEAKRAGLRPKQKTIQTEAGKKAHVGPRQVRTYLKERNLWKPSKASKKA
jgi:hypothetical protein